ncbi:MAG: hypothetical protein D6734_04340 [Candidatus Schekmanbacteria bacterium]|nr:MAG: hypothetical protein D6734_04340 [Candidatus Schekmanbacteria bacterium]
MAKYQYGLDLDFLDSIEERVSVDSLLSGYLEKVKGEDSSNKDEDVKKYFSTKGKTLAEIICDEEKNHRDRMAEVVYEVAKKTGHIFPSIPQRLLEISFYALRPDDDWIYKEVSSNAIEYEVRDCELFNKLKEKAGDEEAKKMPCWNFCRTVSDIIYDKTGVRVKVSMKKSLANDNRCVIRAECYSEV